MRRGGFEPLFRNIKSEFNVHVNEGEYLADLLGLSVCVSDISETGLQESFNPSPLSLPHHAKNIWSYTSPSETTKGAVAGKVTESSTSRGP